MDDSSGLLGDQVQEGVYIDGHERADVVQRRGEYFDEMEEFDRIGLIRVYHDCIFHSNDDQPSFWCDASFNPVKSKSEGRAIMVSDFIVEADRSFLEVGGTREGYWNAHRFKDQMSKAIGIFNFKYPGRKALFVLDNSPCHRRMPSNALNAKAMNRGPAGRQPVMHDTVWNGRPQSLVDENGIPKGLDCVLGERGVDVRGKSRDQLRAILSSHEDFRSEPNEIEKIVRHSGHGVIYLPKFHCELNPIERVWCSAKQYTRSHCDYTIRGFARRFPRVSIALQQELLKASLAVSVNTKSSIAKVYL